MLHQALVVSGEDIRLDTCLMSWVRTVLIEPGCNGIICILPCLDEFVWRVTECIGLGVHLNYFATIFDRWIDRVIVETTHDYRLSIPRLDLYLLTMLQEKQF